MSKSIQFQKDGENLYPCPFYPVGSIYLSITTTNPSTYFGGTWSQIAQGRTLVGVDTSQTEFKTVKKTGGEKAHTLTVNEMPSHSHSTDPTLYKIDYNYTKGVNGFIGWADYSGGGAVVNNKTGGGQAHNNLQPYYTCYIWLRTA